MKIIVAAALLTVFAAFSSPGVAADGNEGPVAVAFTGPEGNGYSWIINKPGDYDLHDFALPNDSISSIVVRPGYRATLYAESGFQGEKLECDSPSSLPDKWLGRVSSLGVVSTDEEAPAEEVKEWEEQLDLVEDFTPVLESRLDADAFNAALIENAYGLNTAGMQMSTPMADIWKSFTEEQRAEMTKNMLKAITALGYDASAWEPEALAKRTMNFLAWRRDMSALEAFAAALGIDPETSWAPDMSGVFLGVWRLAYVCDFYTFDESVKKRLQESGVDEEGDAPDGVDLATIRFDDDGTYVMTGDEGERRGEYAVEGFEAILDPGSGGDRDAVEWNAWYKALRYKFKGFESIFEKKDGADREPADKRAADGKAPGSIELFARDADLSLAPDVIVEPDQPPQNLGGWKTGNIVLFAFAAEKAGMHRMTLVYSKNENDGDDAQLCVTLWDKKGGTAKGETLTVDLPTTGSGWSNYEEVTIGRLELPENTATLALMSSADRTGRYVMNLRELRLTPVSAGEDGGEPEPRVVEVPEEEEVGKDLRSRRGYAGATINAKEGIHVLYFLFDNRVLQFYHDEPNMGPILKVDLSSSPDPQAAMNNLVFEDVNGDGYNDLRIEVSPGQWKTWEWNSEIGPF